MREFGAFQAKNKLGQLVVEQGVEITITINRTESPRRRRPYPRPRRATEVRLFRLVRVEDLSRRGAP
jgi:hypothetical protein